MNGSQADRLTRAQPLLYLTFIPAKSGIKG